MNGDVQYDLTGGHVSFDTLWRLDQLAATLTDHDGWRVVVEVDPGVVLTASPARGLHAAGTALEALLSPQDGSGAHRRPWPLLTPQTGSGSDRVSLLRLYRHSCHAVYTTTRRNPMTDVRTTDATVTIDGDGPGFYAAICSACSYADNPGDHWCGETRYYKRDAKADAKNHLEAHAAWARGERHKP